MNYVYRWIISRVDKHGARVLAEPAQGRYTYASREDAARILAAWKRNTSDETMQSVFGDVSQMQVNCVRCYPGHFDPIGIYV